MPVSFQRCCSSRNFGKGMVERLVRIDQLLQLLDNPQLDLQVLLFLGFEIGDELVAATAVLLEQLLELHLDAVHSRCEILFGAAFLDEFAACGFDLGAADAVEGDLQRLHIPADRLHGLLFEHARKQSHQLLLAPAREFVFGIGGASRHLLGLGLLGGLALQFESGVLRRQRGLLVREIHLHVGRRSLLFRLRYDRFGRRLDPGAFRTRRLFSGSRFRSRFGGRSLGNDLCGGDFSRRHLRRRTLPVCRRLCGSLAGSRSFRSRFGDGLFGRRFAYGRLGGGRCGFALRGSGRFGFCSRSRFGIRDFGSHFGSCLLHIFSSLADLLLRSRKNRIFSSHLNTRF